MATLRELPPVKLTFVDQVFAETGESCAGAACDSFPDPAYNGQKVEQRMASCALIQSLGGGACGFARTNAEIGAALRGESQKPQIDEDILATFPDSLLDELDEFGERGTL